MAAKVTPKQFNRFKAAFLHFQKEFGVMDYRAGFLLQKWDSEAIAKIRIDHQGRTCKVSLSAELEKRYLTGEQLVTHAKHEALHLLLSRLNSLAFSRFVIEREIDDAEEGIVTVLEKVVPNPNWL